MRNTLPFGLLVGLIVPIVAFSLMLLLNQVFQWTALEDQYGSIFQFSERLSVLVAACSNAFAFRLFNKRRMTEAMRGLVFPTLALVAYWLWRYVF